MTDHDVKNILIKHIVDLVDYKYGSMMHHITHHCNLQTTDVTMKDSYGELDTLSNAFMMRTNLYISIYFGDTIVFSIVKSRFHLPTNYLLQYGDETFLDQIESYLAYYIAPCIEFHKERDVARGLIGVN